MELEQWKSFHEPQSVCPKCKSDNIENAGPDEDNRLAVTCHNCSYQWYEPSLIQVELYYGWYEGNAKMWETTYVDIPISEMSDSEMSDKEIEEKAIHLFHDENEKNIPARVAVVFVGLFNWRYSDVD